MLEFFSTALPALSPCRKITKKRQRTKCNTRKSNRAEMYIIMISCRIQAETSLAKAALTLTSRVSVITSPVDVTHQTMMRAVGDSNGATRSSKVSENSWRVFAPVDDCRVSDRMITPLLSTWQQKHYHGNCCQTGTQKTSSKFVLNINV